MNDVRKMVMTLSMLVLLSPAALVKAQQPEVDPNISYRRNVMKSIADNMGAIGDILKNRLPMNEHLADHAKNVERSAAMIAKAFEKQVNDNKEGGSKDEIWKEMAKFKEKADALTKEAGAFVAVMGGGDSAAIMGQMQKVGKACKSCHEDFRKPKN